VITYLKNTVAINIIVGANIAKITLNTLLLDVKFPIVSE